jgi:hypothetical protein
MAKKVIWSPRALAAHQRVIEYLQQKWTDKEIIQFIEITNKTLALVSSGKIKFRHSKKRNVYEVLVTKHNLLLYRETKNAIELLTFWDTRQSPKKKFSNL